MVPLQFNLRELHLVLQAAFGWMNAHMHEFEIGGLSFADEFAQGQPTARNVHASCCTCLGPFLAQRVSAFSPQNDVRNRGGYGHNFRALDPGTQDSPWHKR